jgi:hypothetical protein
MFDMTQISAVLTSIKTATDIAGLVKDSDTTLEKAEIKLKLAELISTLADTKIQIAEIQQTLIDKDSELKAAKEQLDIKTKLHWGAPYYWIIDGDKKDGPYCQCCSDKDHLLIRLQGNGNGHWRCGICKSGFTDKTYQPSKVGGTGRRTWMDRMG